MEHHGAELMMTMYIFDYSNSSPQARSRSICLSQSAYPEVLKISPVPFLAFLHSWCGLHYLGRTSRKLMSTYHTHICECPVFSLWAVRQQGLDVLKPWEGSAHCWHIQYIMLINRAIIQSIIDCSILVALYNKVKFVYII